MCWRRVRTIPSIFATIRGNIATYSGSPLRNGIVSQRQFSSYAISTRTRFDNVPLGSTLQLLFGSLPVHVRTLNGPHEVVRVICWAAFEKGDGVPDWQNTESLLSFVLDEDKGRQVIRAHLQPSFVKSHQHSSPLYRCVAIVPPRYFNLHIVTGAGSVHLSEVKEAKTVVVQSAGGAVTAESLQASKVEVNTGGGVFSVNKLVGGTVNLCTRRVLPSRADGDVKAKTLAAETMTVQAGTARVSAGACFADSRANINCQDISIESLRGGISVAHEHDRCWQGDVQVTLTGRGATAHVGGLDGNLAINAPGGSSIDIQVNDGAKNVAIDAEMCDTPTHASLYVARTLNATLDVGGARAAQCTLPADAVGSYDASSNSLHAFLFAEANTLDLPEVQGFRHHRHDMGWTHPGGLVAPQAACHLAVRGNCDVVVSRRSWMEGRRSAYDGVVKRS